MSDAAAIDVALIGHPSDYKHFVSLVEETDGVEAARRVVRNERTFTALLDWMPAYATRHRPVIRLEGATVRAALVVCPFLPQAIESPHKLKRAFTKVLQAVDVAAGLGAKVATLGGFTSILAGQHRFDVADAAGITLTTGNALTAALAVASLRDELDARGRSLGQETVGIIGASGDVGGTAAALLGAGPRRLLLAAQDEARLEQARQALGHPDAVCVPVSEVAAQAGVILVATSAIRPILAPHVLPELTIVFDLGYPRTLVGGQTEGSGAKVLRTGLAAFPTSVNLGAYTQLSRPDHLFGCFTQGVVLAARPDLRNLARAQGRTRKEEALVLLEAALSLGIKAAAEMPGADLEECAETTP
jgi:fatty aldehyde-generating acyl-ACP reductase